MTRPISWYARRYTERFGMAVIPIKHKSKLPIENNWGNNALTNPDDAEQYWSANPELNIGLALGPSKLCSLDIDCMESFQTIADEFGIDLRDELKGVPTIQGADKGMRCLFRVPAASDLMEYHKVSWPSAQDPTGELHRQMMRDAKEARDAGDTEREETLREQARALASYTVFEMRVATDSKQRYDVLPPSIHPETGKPYRWIVQPPKTLADWPEPPPWLMAIWDAWDSFRPQLLDACPWKPEPERPCVAPAPSQQSEGTSVIDAYTAANDLRSTLERYGYTRKGKRYLSPHSGTQLAGVVLFPDEARCFIHHASDPLCSDDTGKPVNSFDLFCCYEHNGDTSKAVKAAAQALGLTTERKRTEQAKAVADTPSTTAPEAPQSHKPFRPLGYNANSFYYLPRGTEQVAEIKRGSHTSPAELMSLAPLEWWEMAYPKQKGGADWHAAANDCMRGCERRGIYSTDRERGRGAWYDKGKAVLHLGNRLLVDGVACSISDHDSDFIYTRQAPMEHGADAVPASDQDATLIADLFDELNWTKPVYADMLAGWCLLAPICGALSWRPHVWLTAQRGAGKSWMQDHIIHPLLGPSAMMVQGSTTEAGVRQTLRSDSRPIVFDEAESEDHKSQSRMQNVIELARQSSSDSTAQIVKGTVSGQGMSFRMRSMFLLGSVNVSLSQAADESRFSVLTLATPAKTAEEVARFETFSKRVDNLLSDSACAALRARAYRLMPVIRANCKTFSRAVAEVLGSQRIGDQVGTLLAGSYAYRSSELVSLDAARVMVENMDFSDAKEAEQVSDEESCLQHILQYQIRFDSDIGHIQRSIGEMVAHASGSEHMHGITQMAANDVLRRYGLAVDGNALVVANNHVELSKVLHGTAWGAGWRRILARIEGAQSVAEAVRFSGTRSRAVKIPLDFLE